MTAITISVYDLAVFAGMVAIMTAHTSLIDEMAYINGIERPANLHIGKNIIEKGVLNGCYCRIDCRIMRLIIIWI